MADFTKLKITELVKRLNSTQFGAVTTAKIVQRDFEKFGLRIAGDENCRTIHFFRYGAQLFDSLHQDSLRPAPLSSQQMMRRLRETARDVGRHRPTRNPELKRKYRLDLLGFIVELFPRSVPLRMSADHLEFIRQLQEAILHGGQIAIALPRGSGKTTIIKIAMLWATLYGHRRYMLVIAATDKDAKKIIASMKRYFESNDRLAELFPEVCHYVRALEGQTQRAVGQLADGKLTNIVWRSDLLVYPAFAENPELLEVSSQSVLEARGMTGSIRGMQYTDPSGEIRRPEFILLDDPQTRESAKSPEQTKSRIELIDGDIMGCAGPTVELAAVMACTVITDGDLSEHYLSAWRSIRSGFIREWPGNTDLWEQYRALYEEFRRGDKKLRDKVLNDFYTENRAAMDAGAVESWPERVIAPALSSLQTAYNLRCRDGDAAFFSEYQNEPLRQNTSLYTLTQDLILSRTNGVPHRMRPPDTPFLFAAVDVNYYALSYGVAAFRNDFAASVTDYGWFPDSGVVYDPKSSDLSEEAAIYNALGNFCTQIKLVHPGLQVLGIDGNRFTSAVYKFIKNNAHLLPMKLIPLRGVAAKQYREPTLGARDLVGQPRTRCCMKVTRDLLQYAPFDSHYWHYACQKMWLLAPGSPGSLSVFGDRSTDHRRFAEQVVADKLVDCYERYGERIYEWKTIGQNEMSDVVTMLAVLANLAGLDPDGIARQTAARPRKRRRRATVTQI